MRALRLLLVGLLLVAAPAWAKDGQSRFAGLDGFLVHYTDHGAKADKAVILIHGYSLNGTFWRHQIPALARNARVIALDLPGHGQSGKPRDVAYTMDLFARAVEAVAQDAGVARASLVGHSMGLPVIHTVLRRGKLAVDKAVFVDGAIFRGTPEDRKFLAEMTQALKGPDHAIVLEQFFQSFMGKTPAKEKAAVLANLRNFDQPVALSAFQHFGDAEYWAPSRHQVPVLALYAGMSSAGVKEWLGGAYPNHKLVIWDDVDHFPQLSHPDRVNKALVDFLK